MGRKHKTHPAESGYPQNPDQRHFQDTGYQEYYQYDDHGHPSYQDSGHPPEQYQYDYDDYDPGTEFGQSYYLAQSGPLQKKRSCTDILCIFLLLGFVGAWVFVGYLGYREGNINRVIYPTDTQGHVCGYGRMKDRPFLLLFDLTQCLNPAALISGCPTPHVCVPHCPKETYSPWGSLKSQQNENSIKDRMAPYCNVANRNELNGKSVKQLIDDKICPSWYIESSSLFGRCFPMSHNITGMDGEKGTKNDQVLIRASDNPTKQIINVDKLDQALFRLTAYLNFREVGERVFSDLAETWWMIGLSLIGACILSFIWIVLMRFLAGLMVWLSISVIFFGTGGLLGYCAYRLYFIWIAPTEQNLKNILEVNLTPEYLDDLFALRDTWLAFTIILGIIFFVLLCVFIYLRQRILIAIALIEQGSKAVGHMFSTLFFPIIPFIFQLSVAGWFMIVAMYLASSGESQYRVILPDSKCDSISECQNFKSNETCTVEEFKSCASSCPEATCQFFGYKNNKDFSWLQLVNVFGLYWGLFFFSAYGELVLAGVFSKWYWTMKKDQIPSFQLLRSMGNAFFHVGTIAFGSLVLAVIRFIRTIVEYVEKKCKKLDNDLTRCIICMCKCCLWCLEKLMRFFNRNIYIMCAMKGTNFWNSGKDAFNLIMRNLVRVVVLDGVCDFLLFLGKLVIVLITGTISFFFFGRYIPDIQEHIPNLYYMFTPIVFIVIGSYLIASAFFGVYSMAVDTLFLCFLEDLERNDGSPGKEYYMSKSLKKILGKMEKSAAARNTEQYRMVEHGAEARKQP